MTKSSNTIDVKKELEMIERESKKIRSTQKSAREFLVKHGYFTKQGKLTKRYR